MKRKQCLVAIEGIDGGGKSVQAVLLQMALERASYPTVIVKAKQPDQDAIVHDFTKAFSIGSDSMAFMFLYQALHRQQYERTTAALDAGKIVIADRWDMSFFVYHGIAGPLVKRHKHLLGTLNKLAFENLRPDLHFFIDIPVRVALQRRIARGDRIAFPAQEVEFYERVADEYGKLFARMPCHRIDGTLPIEEINRQMLSITLAHIRG